MVGSIYLGCVLVLSLLIGLAGRESHEANEDEDVFRFPKTLIISLRVGAFVPAVLGILIYRTFRNPGLVEMTFLTAFFGSLTLIVLAMLFQVSTFSVTVSRDCLRLKEKGRRRTIDFSAVREVVIAWPWRGNGRLDLLGSGAKRLCRIDAGIQDFDELVSLVKIYCPNPVKITEKNPRSP